MEPTMQDQTQITVNSTVSFPIANGGPLATWALDGVANEAADRGRFPVKPGNVLGFRFKGPGRVTEAVMLVSPNDPAHFPDQDATPFVVASPMTLDYNEANDTYVTKKIRPDANGIWGFSIAFTTLIDNGQNTVNSQFYFLPDPELSVGPGTGEPGQG